MHRRAGRGFSLIVIPAICCAVSFYFAYAGIFGERGLKAWNDTQAELAMSKQQLAAIRAKREALQHRISLLDDRALDSDLLEEVARTVLLETRAGEVAVPREKR